MRAPDCAQENFYARLLEGPHLNQHSPAAEEPLQRRVPDPLLSLCGATGPPACQALLCWDTSCPVLPLAQPGTARAQRGTRSRRHSHCHLCPLLSPGYPCLLSPSVPHLDAAFTPSLKFGNIFSAEPVFWSETVTVSC